MSNLINGRTAEEIKKALELCNMISNRKNVCESCPYNGKCTPEGEPDQPGWDALVYIQRLEAERDAALAKAQKWISVKEKLPEKGDKVLISLCGCNVKEAEYCGDGIFEAAYADTYHATRTGAIVLTHWMPMPEPVET